MLSHIWSCSKIHEIWSFCGCFAFVRLESFAIWAIRLTKKWFIELKPKCFQIHDLPGERAITYGSVAQSPRSKFCWFDLDDWRIAGLI